MIFLFVVGPKLISPNRKCETISFKNWMDEWLWRMTRIEGGMRFTTGFKNVCGGLGVKLIRGLGCLGVKLINIIIEWGKILMHGCYIIKRTFDLIKRVGNNLSNSCIRSIEFKHVQGKVA